MKKQMPSYFETVFAALPLPALLLDSQGIVFSANPPFLKFIGLAEKSIIGRAFADFIAENDELKQEITADFRTGAVNRKTRQAEFALTDGKGALRWVEATLSFPDFEGEALCLAIFQDISRLKRAEEKLKSSERACHFLMNNSHDLMQKVGLDGAILDANRKWLTTLGYRREELSALNLKQVVRPGQLSFWTEMLEKVSEGRKFESVATVLLPKRSKTRSGEVYAVGTVAPLIEGGKVTAAICIFHDVTEQKAAEQICDTLVDCSPVGLHLGIYIVQDGVFKFANLRFQSLTGYSLPELIGKDPLSIVHPDDRQRVRDSAVRMLKEMDPKPCEFRIVKKSGELVWVMETVISTTLYGKRAVLGNIMDITERKKAEETLRESEERYRALVELGTRTGEAIVMLQDTENGTGMHVFFNDVWVQMSGYSREELLARSMVSLIHPRDREAALERHRRRMKGEVLTGLYEVTILRKDGTELPVEVTYAPTTYRGKPANVGFIRDITERKKTEELLRQSEEKFKALFELAPDAFYLNDLKGNLIDGNRAAEEITGYRREELIGKSFLKLKLLPRGQMPKAAKLLAMNVMGKPTGPDEFVLRRKDGSQVPVEIKTFPVKLRGKVIVLGTARDITERKKAEQAVKESEEKYRTLVNSLRLGICRTTPGPEGRYLEVNPAMTQITGYSREELLTMKVADLYAYPEDRDKIMKQIELASGPLKVEFLLRKKDGSLITVEGNPAPVKDAQGKIVYIDSVIEDVTERKRMEAELKQKMRELEEANNRLKELDKLKDNFLSTVSHELRTPLTSIKSFTEILLNYQEDEATQKEFLGIINQESDRLTRLINDFLDLSKIQSGRVQWQTGEVSVQEAIDAAVMATGALISEANLKLSIDIEPDLPPVLCDRDRLVQVLTNLLGNAQKFTPAGGKIDVRARLSKSDGVQAKADMVLVSVADTGIGIAPENHQRIFQKFSQVGDTLRDRPQGTGLGLAICKEIVEHYGGRIWFESEPGKGSTFFFTLPVAVDGKAQLSPETPPPAVAAVRRGTILVVDDEANIRHFISHELSKHGHKVIEADSGKQAINLARQHHPDLITLDVLMPDLDGFDVTAILKNDPQTQDIPILIVSVVEDRKRALQLGASDYITKPCSMEKLLEKVNHLLPVSQKTILIVDDDKALVRSLETELNKRGFATQRAYNGREALKAVERYQPDLILIDIRMPEMDGYETIKVLKSNPETSGIHIIVMTGIEIDDGRVKALSIGAEDYFKKSGSIDQLIQAVERILSTGKKSAG